MRQVYESISCCSMELMHYFCSDDQVTGDQTSAENPEPVSEENPAPADAEDEPEKDSGSKVREVSFPKEKVFFCAVL